MYGTFLSLTAEEQMLDRCSRSMTRTSGVGLFLRVVGGQRAAGGPPLRHAMLPLGVVQDASFRNVYSYSCS